MSLWSRTKNAFRSDHLNAEIDRELDAHIAEAIASGRDPHEVRRSFGSALRHREASRDAKLLPWLDSLRSDATFAIRQLKKQKITTVTAVLSLALAIGASTTVFRLVDGLFFRPLPVSAPDRLYALSRLGSDLDGAPDIYDSQPYPLYQQMSAGVADQADLLALSYNGRTDLTYKSDAETEKAQVQYISSNMFTTFGLKPALGHLLNPTDDDHPHSSPYAVISYKYWSERFGKDPAVLGRTFRLENQIFQIAGVSEKKFTGAEPGVATDIFVPISMQSEGALKCTDCGWFMILVQLRPGVPLQPVRDKLTAAFEVFREQRVKELSALPELFRNMRAEKLLIDPAPAGSSSLQSDYRRPLAALGVLVLLVLLIACANVANLMSAQASGRAREMALRVSLGAGRARLVQLVLVQSAILAALAASAGFLFALWSAPYVVSKINSPDNPAYLALSPDFRIFFFSLALAGAVTLLFGLVPALRASFVKPAAALKGGDQPHSGRRLMHVLIAVQVSFCFLVLFVAGLFLTTFNRLAHQSTGFSSDRLLTLETVTSSPQSRVYWQHVVDHLRGTPGVESASVAGWPLLSGQQRNNFISVHGQPPGKDLAFFMPAGPGWLETLKIPLFDGRDFTPTETDPGSAIVTSAFAKLFFPNENPVGQFFEKTEPHGQPHRYQIVGLVGDVRYQSIRRPFVPAFFVPFNYVNDSGAFEPSTYGTVLVRTTSDNPLALASLLRQEVPRARSEFRVSNVVPQIQINESQTLRERILATLAIFFAAVALLLAGVGLYGVLHYSIQQRRREIGIRIAIGAQAKSIIRLVTAQIIFAITTGAVAGLLLGISGSRYLTALFYQVRATDISILAFPTTAIFLAATAAAFPAVLRAIRTDPAEILRSD